MQPLVKNKKHTKKKNKKNNWKFKGESLIIVTYSKRHGMGDAKLGDIPCPEWFEVIRQADLSTSV